MPVSSQIFRPSWEQKEKFGRNMLTSGRILEQFKHIWEQSKHTWEQSKHIWEQSKHIWEECVKISKKTPNNPKCCPIAPMPTTHPPSFYTQFGITKTTFGRSVSKSGSNRSILGSILLQVGSNRNTLGSILSFCLNSSIYEEDLHTYPRNM